jgi:hypothetical protein
MIKVTCLLSDFLHVCAGALLAIVMLYLSGHLQ